MHYPSIKPQFLMNLHSILFLFLLNITTKMVQLIFTLLLTLSLLTTSTYSSAFSAENTPFSALFHHKSTLLEEESSSSSPLRTTSRASSMTCNKYPRLCRLKGSPGPDCCSKKCVNVTTDRSNCGFCGKKCKVSQLCCKGLCVNYLTDNKNCGKCKNKCKKGHKCVNGMCNYA